MYAPCTKYTYKYLVMIANPQLNSNQKDLKWCAIGYNIDACINVHLTFHVALENGGHASKGENERKNKKRANKRTKKRRRWKKNINDGRRLIKPLTMRCFSMRALDAIADDDWCIKEDMVAMSSLASSYIE